MAFDHRTGTWVTLEAFEAYAADAMRCARIVGTEVVLRLRATDDTHRAVLRQLGEGDRATPPELEQLVPGLPDRQWAFATDNAGGCYVLRTASDGIDVSLAMPVHKAASAFDAQGQLRGLAARLVTSMIFPPTET